MDDEDFFAALLQGSSAAKKEGQAKDAPPAAAADPFADLLPGATVYPAFPTSASAESSSSYTLGGSSLIQDDLGRRRGPSGSPAPRGADGSFSPLERGFELQPLRCRRIALERQQRCLRGRRGARGVPSVRQLTGRGFDFSPFVATPFNPSSSSAAAGPAVYPQSASSSYTLTGSSLIQDDLGPQRRPKGAVATRRPKGLCSRRTCGALRAMRSLGLPAWTPREARSKHKRPPGVTG